MSWVQPRLVSFRGDCGRRRSWATLAAPHREVCSAFNELTFRSPHRQAEVQHQAVEDLHRLLQLPPNRRHHRREDLHHARRTESRPSVDGADQASDATDRRSRYWYVPLSPLSPPSVARVALGAFADLSFALSQDSSATSSGQTQTRTSPAGRRTIVECPSPLDPTLFPASFKSTTWTSSAAPTRSSRTATSSLPSGSWLPSSRPRTFYFLNQLGGLTTALFRNLGAEADSALPFPSLHTHIGPSTPSSNVYQPFLSIPPSLYITTSPSPAFFH